MGTKKFFPDRTVETLLREKSAFLGEVSPSQTFSLRHWKWDSKKVGYKFLLLENIENQRFYPIGIEPGAVSTLLNLPDRLVGFFIHCATLPTLL
jgi:hypothetical protein